MQRMSLHFLPSSPLSDELLTFTQKKKELRATHRQGTWFTGSLCPANQQGLGQGFSLIPLTCVHGHVAQSGMTPKQVLVLCPAGLPG